MAVSLSADIRTLVRATSARRRRQLAIVTSLMPATALAEMALVGTIVPFLAVLAGRANPSQHVALLSALQQVFGGWIHGNPILAAAILFASAVLATMLCRLALSWTSQKFAFGFGHELAVEIQRRLLHQPYIFYLGRHSSELLTVLDKIDFLVFSTALQGIQAISSALICLFVVAVLLWIDPLSATLAALFIGGLYGLMLILARRRLGSYAGVIRAAFDSRLKAAQDSLGAIRDIILDRSQDIRVDRFREIDARFMRARADAQFLVAQ